MHRSLLYRRQTSSLSDVLVSYVKVWVPVEVVMVCFIYTIYGVFGGCGIAFYGDF